MAQFSGAQLSAAARRGERPGRAQTLLPLGAGGVDFTYLDNASNSFSKEQLEWFDRISKRDETDNTVLSVVVGMHEALPDSIASTHAMCDDPRKVDSCTS